MTFGEEMPAAAAAPPAKTRALTADAIASIVLVLFAVLVNLVISFAGVMLVMMSDGCSGTCNVDVLSGGVIFASVAPSVVTVIGIIITIRRVMRRKRAFWVPLATIAGQIVALVIGALVVFGSIGQL